MRTRAPEPVTQQQRDNALFARDVMWPSIPDENIIAKLSTWRRRRNNGDPNDYGFVVPRKVDCKTVACFGGWIAANPYFKAQGVRADSEGAPVMGGRASVAQALFGDSALGLFATNTTGTRSDRDEVTRRLTALINSTVVVS